MQLGIYANYDRGEQTAMAVRLAFTALRAGWSVRWLAPRASGSPVHPYWDAQVRRLPQAPQRYELLTKAWAAKTDCRVWFTGCDLTARRCVDATHRAKRKGSQDIVVPAWHANGKDPANAVWVLNGFHVVVFPHSVMLRAMQRHAEGNPRLQAVAAAYTPPIRAVCRWPSGVKPALRSGLLDLSGDAVKVAFYADARTCRHHGRGIVEVVASVLDTCPHVTAVLAADYAPDRTEARAYRSMARTYGERFDLKLRPRLDSTLALVHESDWLAFLPTRCDVGLLPAQAQALGVPSIVWAVEPLHGVVCGNYAKHCGLDGVTVACDVEKSEGSLIETAVWDSEAMAVAVVKAAGNDLASRQRLMALQTGCFRRAGYTHDQEFHVFWDRATTPACYTGT